ncbi:hypothetical protein LMH87_011749 [Akanthomyces muscarius]|uniref:Uncharacterized protein n=1 Tax=Akanthomyces muscarius TaxID=2231603 RepID=A0A9W8QAJ9_AKAMU|nr:hypothetical protein LMH87_011749 [Akanthomyces muscarius]KAJ4151029.1 hypothetical protein LMH87_011749 [Akanthomyces muscarius]
MLSLPGLELFSSSLFSKITFHGCFKNTFRIAERPLLGPRSMSQKLPMWTVVTASSRRAACYIDDFEPSIV